MKVAFTGTRKGMNDKQKEITENLLRSFQKNYDVERPGVPMVGVHGDCVGADKDFHDICRKLDMSVMQRPCTLEDQRAHTDAVEIALPEAPLDRNKKIVDDGEILIGIPGEQEEQFRSGTWSTIRYAKKTKKPVVIIWPNGHVVRTDK